VVVVVARGFCGAVIASGAVCGASTAIAGISPKKAARLRIRAAVVVLMMSPFVGMTAPAKEGKLVRGGRLVTPAEAEDAPSPSLVDASLWSPKFTLLGDELHLDDHSDGDVGDRVDLFGVLDAGLVEGDVVWFAAFVGGQEPADAVDDAGCLVDVLDVDPAVGVAVGVVPGDDAEFAEVV
jgi:hypothetical protein